MLPKSRKRCIALILVALASLARAGVEVGYDTQVDFSQFKTYGWMEGGWQAPKLITEKRIHAAVEQELEAKGRTC
jgi:hypothetical protein